MPKSNFESIEEDYLKRVAKKSYQEKGFGKRMCFKNFHKFLVEEIKPKKDRESELFYKQLVYNESCYDGFLQMLEATENDFLINHGHTCMLEDDACVSNLAYGTIALLSNGEIEYMIGMFKEREKFEKFKNTYIQNGYEKQLSFNDFVSLSQDDCVGSLEDYFRVPEEIETDIYSFEFCRYHTKLLGDIRPKQIQPQIDRLIECRDNPQSQLKEPRHPRKLDFWMSICKEGYPGQHIFFH